MHKISFKVFRPRLSQVTENGKIKNTYLYGALNRLEQATDAKGLIARYSYDGLGHRVSRQVGNLSSPQLGGEVRQQLSKQVTQAKVSNMSQVDVAKNLAIGLDPMQQLNTKTQITNPMSRIDYVIDLTKEYRNMLSSTSYEYDLNANEDITANTIGSVSTNTPADITASAPINASTQTFTWADEELVESSTDIAMNMGEKSGADIAAFSDSGYNFQLQNRYTFLNDDLGSTMRMSNGAGVVQATYAYDEFGQEILDGINTLKNTLGKVADLVNPFGFVGYQLDNIADDYFAEAREYRPEEGRFSGIDKVRGFIEMPFTLNRYGYCYNNGMLMNDLNGMWPNPIKWVKDKTKKAAKAVGSAVKSVGNYVKSHKRQIIGGLIQGVAVGGAVALVAFSGGAAAPLVAGALMGAGCSLGDQIANNKGGKVDWGDVAIQGAAGAAFAVLPGAVVGKSVTGLAKYAGIGAVNAAIGGAATLATDLKNGEKKEQIVKDVAASTASNFVCGMISEGANNLMELPTNKMKENEKRPLVEEINKEEGMLENRKNDFNKVAGKRKKKGISGSSKKAKGRAMKTIGHNMSKMKSKIGELKKECKEIDEKIDIKYGPLKRGLQKIMDWLVGIELEGYGEGLIKKQISGASSCAN